MMREREGERLTVTQQCRCQRAAAVTHDGLHDAWEVGEG